MKTLWRICLVLVILALPVATAAAAVGKKPPTPPPTTTTTTTAPSPTLFGTTCASDLGYEAALASHHYTLTENGFSFTLSGKNDALCIDVLHGTPGIWMVSIVGNAGTTTLSRILLVPRDSIAPGDSCGGVDLRRVALPLQQQLPHPDDTRFDVIANGYVNACGTAFGELVDIDGDEILEEVGTVMPDSPHPLAFQVYMAAVAATSSVTVTVTLP
jgi:hypothetical protein